jgi:hypothetical protein
VLSGLYDSLKGFTALFYARKVREELTEKLRWAAGVYRTRLLRNGGGTSLRIVRVENDPTPVLIVLLGSESEAEHLKIALTGLLTGYQAAVDQMTTNSR